MKKLILPVLFILLGFIVTTAQKRMNFESKPMSLAVPRVNNNEAVVIISAPDIYQLNFESTMDKTVNVYNTVNESSYNYYFLKFIVGEIYKDRKIEIKVDGYDKTVIAVPLTAKEVQSFYVYDPDGTVGVGCYFKNRNEGNGYFEKAMYSEAREKYNLALICSDTPVDNDLKKRIEDSEMCTFLRRKADNSFSEGKYEEAEEYYKVCLKTNFLQKSHSSWAPSWV